MNTKKKRSARKSVAQKLQTTDVKPAVIVPQDPVTVIEQRLDMLILLRNTWELYKNRFISLFLISFIGQIIILFLLICFFIFSIYSLTLDLNNPLIFLLLLLISVGVFIAITTFWAWQVIAMYHVITASEKIGVKESLISQKKNIWQFVTLKVLMGFRIFAFSIPFSLVGLFLGYIFQQQVIVAIGILISLFVSVTLLIWYCVSNLTFLLENRRGMDALAQSKWYVSGYFWQIGSSFISLAIILLIVLAIGSIFKSIGQFIANVAVIPFIYTFFYCIYKRLQAIKNIA